MVYKRRVFYRFFCKNQGLKFIVGFLEVFTAGKNIGCYTKIV
jgi:hypothetical protein